MSYPVRFLSILLFLTVFSFSAFAEAPKYVEPRLFSPVTATGTDTTIKLALQLKLQPKWDTYWRIPGDAGLPPDLDWKGSENFQSYKMDFPAPVRQTIEGIENNIYLDEVTFPLTVTLAKPGEALDLKLKLALLVCNEICVPEKHELSFHLPAGAAEPSPDEALYKTALEKLPRTQIEGFSLGRAWLESDDGKKSVLVIEGGAPDKPSAGADIFIEHDEGISFGKPDIAYDAATKKMTLRIDPHSTDMADVLKTKLSAGDLTLTYVDGANALEAKTSLGEKPESAPQKLPTAEKIKEKMDDISLGILLAALLGGLILNLMPCVLPVLSLKVLSVVSHGGKDTNRKTIFRNFTASAAGIIVSFWLMAGALVALKAGGSSIGWGIQFQHPGFLVFLMVILLLFAANMWGAFEIPLPRFIANKVASRHEQEPTALGHFMTGVFATLLATPCTAPFLGTAIGFALARGAYEIFMIFTFIGLGLALPYFALALSPALFRFMPKPGAWMVRLRRALALALVITAVWLGNVLLTVTTMPALDTGWQKFDAALIAPAVASGKTVIVDVTADWCLTCKANKKFVLEQDDVVEALSAPNILRLQADFTQQDESIGEYLKTFGRFGIPFNVVYGPNAPKGIPLPELLTKKAIMEGLAEAAGE